MRTRLTVLIALLAAIPVSVLAQDANGKWNATVQGPQGDFAMVFEFAVDGDQLSGSMSNEFMGTTPISNASINGEELAFELTFQGPNGAMTISYTATVDGDTMNMKSKFKDAPPGSPGEASFTATRAE